MYRLLQVNVIEAILLGFAGFAVLIVLGAFRSSWLRRRREKRDAWRVDVAREAGLHLPTSLKPIIDPQLCSGCLACLDVCPEGEIFGVAEGKAIVVEASRCIGHGVCATTCPTGAIELVFGSVEKPVEVPQTDPNFETSRPGLHIVGELGGMGLLRNAIKQGLDVAKHLSETLSADSEIEKDVAIIGAGPAGIATSVACRALGMSIRVIDQDVVGGTIAHYPRQKVVTVDRLALPLYGELSSGTVSKEELLEAFSAMLTEAEVTVHERVRALDIRGCDGDFEIVTSGGTFRARKVVLATGRRGAPRKLDVPGEELDKVTYELIDPAQYENSRVLVVGGGDSALEAASMLAKAGVQTVLSYRGNSFKRGRLANRQEVDRLQARGQLEVLLESEVTSIEAHHVRLEVSGRRAKIGNDFVIVCIGGSLPTQWLKDLGVGLEQRTGDPVAAKEAVRESRNRNVALLAAGLTLLGIAATAGLTYLGWNYYLLPRSARIDAELHEMLRPSGIVGHGIGLLATAMLVSNFMYSLRKRRGWFRALSLRSWMTLHVFFGLFGCGLTAYHSAFQSNNILATATSISLALVVVTGVVGRYIYGLVPAEDGKAIDLESLKKRQTRLLTELNLMASDSPAPRRTEVIAKQATEFVPASGSLFQLFLRAPFNFLKSRQMVASYRRDFANRGDYERFRAAFLEQMKVRTQLVFYRSLRRLMSVWRFVHILLAALLVVFIGAHIVVSLTLGFGWILF